MLRTGVQPSVRRIKKIKVPLLVTGQLDTDQLVSILAKYIKRGIIQAD